MQIPSCSLDMQKKGAVTAAQEMVEKVEDCYFIGQAVISCSKFVMNGTVNPKALARRFIRSNQ